MRCKFVGVLGLFHLVCQRRLQGDILITTISNGNRSPIESVMINKIGGSPICLIKSMIRDRIRQHKVLLPINHNFDKICDIIGYF